MNHIRPIIIALLALAALLAGSDTAQADFGPFFQPCSEVSVVDTTPGATSDIDTVLGTGLSASCTVTTNRDEHKQYNFDTIISFTPPEWLVPADADITDGAQVGRLDASQRLGLVNNPCTNTLPVGFDLLDATTDQSKPIAAKAPGEKDRLSPLAVIEGNGIPAGANKWPTYITDVLDEADFSQLRARLFGANTVTVPGTTVILNFMIFEPGAKINNRLQIDPALGPFSVTILQDPSAETSDEDPVNDFCAPLREATSFLGTASDGSTFRTNPGAGNYNFLTAAMSQRDVDLDGIENSLDPCLFVSNPPEGEADYWNPRGPSVQPGDRDGDGLPNVCDPDPDNIPHPGGDPCSGTSGVGLIGTDEDCDHWMNMADNCPLVNNVDQNDEDNDGLGDACDVAGRVITRGDGSPYTLLGPSEADGDDSILSGPLVTTVTIGAGGAPTPTADDYIVNLDFICLDTDPRNGSCDFLEGTIPTPPPNDNFASAIQIPALPFTDSLESIGATTEPAEPLGCGYMSNTVWYSYTSTTPITLEANTFGSSFDTVLAAYTGNTLPNLLLVGCNDQAFPVPQSQITVSVPEATTIFFQVGGFPGFPSNLVFNLELADTDGDGILDDDDNCPTVANPSQTDSDFDGLGNECDDDDDNDGVLDVDDVFCRTLPEDFDGFADTDGCPDPDNDFDGVCDPWTDFTLPLNFACTGTDTCPSIVEDIDAYKDDDGCPDPDNDTDGFPDVTDDCPGTDWTAGPDGIADTGDEPLNELSVPIQTKEDYDGILDNDGCHDSPGDDYDEDGWTDEQEALDLGTNPAQGCAATPTANDEGPPDAWPLDFNDDQIANLEDVVIAFVISLLPAGLDQPAAGPLVRMDFVDDGIINLQDVVLGFIIKLEPTGLDTSCAP